MSQLRSTFPGLRPSIALLSPLVLWILLWGGLQAGFIEDIFKSGDPETVFNRLRSVLPLWAGYVAMMMFVVKIARHQNGGISFFGPLGLITGYGLIGVAASFVSSDGSVALYWAAAYLSVPLVLWGVVWGGDGLGTIQRIVNLNGLIVVAGVVVLFVAALLYLNLSTLFLTPSSWFDCPLNSDWLGDSWHKMTSGILRPTGVGRYAALAGLIALGGLWRKQWRLLWVPILLAAVVLLLTSGARGAFGGFAGGALLIILYHGGKKAIVGGALVALILAPVVWFTGIHDEFLDSCVLRGGSSAAPPPAQAFPARQTVRLTLPVEVTVPRWGWYLQQISSEGTGFPGSLGEIANGSTEQINSGETAVNLPSAGQQGNSEVNTQVLIPSQWSAQSLPSGQEAANPESSLPESSLIVEVPPGLWALQPWALIVEVPPGLWALQPWAELQQGGNEPSLLKVPAGEVLLTHLPSSTAPQEPDVQTMVRAPARGITSLTGRTTVWVEGLRLFKEQPLIGYGFQADRLLLVTHMHNSFLQALIQTGLAGTVPFVLALLFAWVLVIKALRKAAGLPTVHKHLLVQVAAILIFFSFRAIPESSGALFGVDWLILAPILVYLQIVGRAVNRTEEGA